MISKMLLVGIAVVVSSHSYAQGLQCADIPVLFNRFYLANHVSVKELNDGLKSKVIDQFIKNMDPSKSILLKADVEKLKTDVMAVFKGFEKNDCSALDKAQDLVVERTKSVEEYVKTVLDAKYKLDQTVEFNSDPEKRGYPATDKEQKDLLTKLIHFQIANYLLTDTKLEEARIQLIHRYELITKRVIDRKAKETLNVFMESFAAALDPHSTYLSASQLEDFKIDMGLSLEGIGASLSSQDGFTVVEEVVPGGAADRANVLKPKDKIIAVSQEGQKPVNVMDMELRDVVRLIRGKKGSKVTLTILRKSEKTACMEVTIKRDKIDLKESAAKITYQDRKIGDKKVKIGVLELPSFYGDVESGQVSCYNDVKKLLVEANKQKIDGLVLNLSRNGGGLLDEAVRISGLFFKRGAVVATKDAKGRDSILEDTDGATVYSGPLVVLNTRASASASEILTGALRDYKRIVAVGADHTFGKGSVQSVLRLPENMGAIKVTTGMFYLPGGQSTQHLGVPSHIVVPSLMNNDEIGEKNLDNSLPPTTMKAFLGKDILGKDPTEKWLEVTDDVVTKLAANSKDRIAKSEKFKELQKEIDEMNKNKGVISLAEVMSKTKVEKRKKEESKTRLARIQDQDAPFVNEAVDITRDLIAIQLENKVLIGDKVTGE